ncbi:hypothetical protein CV102_04050 [Natronococcus pandeyae]|uniref:DUF7967 domain-containing protein n=1 Tax=Natronococcus pandeyae TaxID=2055836 RepID=A0A8J8Q619_9EURY|nr:hypothetical protein [Natronococcus pandeyae]TYL39477.1 hypothetical protein CV102_04050 [Natronococcus pandeyae]
MSDSTDSTVRCWLVERTFDDRNLVTTVYATPDGSHYQQRERSATSLQNGSAVTAATEIPESELEAVPDEDTRERYAEEVERTAEQYDPDEAI